MDPKPHSLRAGVAAAGVLFLAVVAPAHEGSNPSLHSAVRPLPRAVDLDARKVALGERLFRDPRLAENGRLACSSCHQLEAGGDDGLSRSVTNNGEPDAVNAPTVFNAAFNHRLTWRGAFRTLEEQAEADLHNPRHAATTWPKLLERIGRDADYRRLFRAIYGRAPDREAVLDALATFERSLITPDAPFDRYLRGERDALTPQQKRGWRYFVDYGCIGCHQGINIGGNLFARFGVFADPPGLPGDEKVYLGRFLVTGNKADRYVFRVPSLRNVAVTAPYFHDGSAATLEEAVRRVARLQLGRTLPEEHVADLVAFLHSLTGRWRGRSLASPPETEDSP